jgi:hypothetical protein
MPPLHLRKRGPKGRIACVSPHRWEKEEPGFGSRSLKSMFFPPLQVLSHHDKTQPLGNWKSLEDGKELEFGIQ